MTRKIVKLGDVCERVSVGHVGQTTDYYTDSNGVPFLRTQNVNESGINLSDLKFITKEFHCSLKKSTLRAGDVVLSRVISTRVNSGIIPPSLDGANCANIILARPISNLLCSRYLNHLLHSKPVQGFLMSRQVGSAQSVVNTTVLKNLELSLPSVEEQKRIAAILDKADSLHRKRQQALQLADDFLRATFLDLFGDPVTNPKGWADEHVLSDVADIVSGITKGRSVNGKQLIEVPYLAVSNVQDRFLKLDVVKKIEATQDEIDRYRLHKNDLLLTEGGDPDKLGRGALWNNDIDNCIHQNHVFRVRINSNLIDPVYLCWLIGSQRGKKYFLRAAKQTTGIASINMRQLKEFPLLIPPVALQEKFLKIVNRIELIKEKFGVADFVDLQESISSHWMA